MSVEPVVSYEKKITYQNVTPAFFALTPILILWYFSCISDRKSEN